MPLTSNLFKDDEKLNACLIDNAAHLTEGAAGDHVGKVQIALIDIDGLEISESELKTKRYGPSTAAAVLKYKQKRKIINRSYQSHEDNIVGKMTIDSLDKEMFDKQEVAAPLPKLACSRPADLETSVNQGGAAARARLVLSPSQRLLLRG